MRLTIRRFEQSDIGFALAQTAREGWDATAELFELCRLHDWDGCFIGVINGERVGMVTTTCYRQTGWIGNLIVMPEQRRRGIGRHLMMHAIQHLLDRGVRTLRLEADPPGIPLYRRLGFVDEFESLRFRLDRPRPVPGPRAEPLAASDLPAVAAFDVEHFGDDRSRLLSLLFERATAAYWLRQPDWIQGYALVSPSRSGVCLGPCIATSAEAGETLLRSVLGNLSGGALVVGVPAMNHEAVALLEACGFRRTPSSYRMVYGERRAARHPEHVFAIANGAMG